MTVRTPRARSARTLLAGMTELDPLRIEPTELEIRSGIGVLFRDALKRGVPAEIQDEISANLARNILIDRFVAEWGYDVAYDKAKDFHAWLVTNEKGLARECPDGVHYRGTYAIASGERRETGRYRTIWGFETFNAMQYLAEALSDQTSGLRRLMDEFNAFRDRTSAAAEVEWMMVPAAGAHRF